MPKHRHLLRPSCTLLPLLLLASCSSVHPDGALKSVVEGDIFQHTAANPAEQRKKEEIDRQNVRQTPPPADDPAPVRLRIPL